MPPWSLSWFVHPAARTPPPRATASAPPAIHLFLLLDMMVPFCCASVAKQRGHAHLNGVRVSPPPARIQGVPHGYSSSSSATCFMSVSNRWCMTAWEYDSLSHSHRL